MRFNHSTFVLRMELYPDEPFVSRNLDDFGQSAFRVDTGGDHTCFFKILPVFAVELIPAAVCKKGGNEKNILLSFPFEYW